MLVPLTREKFEQLVPLIATGSQYKYYWGKFSDFLQRLLISVVIAAIVLVAKVIFRLSLGPIVFFLGLVGALYWLWGPVLWASLRNWKCRRYKYAGFFRGRVLDWWITEELLGKQETVNNRGDLVIVENREKRINLEVGDETGFTALLKAPLKVSHKIINPGQFAEMLVMSNRPDLSIIEEISDIYIPNRNLWVSDYPFLRQDFFKSVSRRIRDNSEERSRNRRRRPSRERSREIPRRIYNDEDEWEGYSRNRSREIERRSIYDDEEW
ncbi:MAG: phosphate ABC transporter permease [Cyanobacteria bacterium P01_D01_bin.50]